MILSCNSVQEVTLKLKHSLDMLQKFLMCRVAKAVARGEFASTS